MKLKIFYLVIAFALYGCVSTPLIQKSNFNAVAVGSEIEGIIAVYGEPYEVRELPNGIAEYRYLQRYPCGTTTIEQVEYIFQVRNGKVVGKNCLHSNNVSSLQFTQ